MELNRNSHPYTEENSHSTFLRWRWNLGQYDYDIVYKKGKVDKNTFKYTDWPFGHWGRTWAIVKRTNGREGEPNHRIIKNPNSEFNGLLTTLVSPTDFSLPVYRIQIPQNFEQTSHEKHYQQTQEQSEQTHQHGSSQREKLRTIDICEDVIPLSIPKITKDNRIAIFKVHTPQDDNNQQIKHLLIDYYEA